MGPSNFHKNGWLTVVSFPPSSLLLSSTPSIKSGAWTDLITKMLSVLGSRVQSWLEEPEGSHCIILAPAFLDSWLISRFSPLLKLRIWYELPFFMNFQRWLKRPFFFHWISLTPPYMLASGTSTTLKQLGFSMMTVLCRIELLSPMG